MTGPKSTVPNAMSKNQLAKIQSDMCGLWTNRQKRKEFTDGGALAAGVAVYSRLIEIGRVDLMTSIYPLIQTLLSKNFKSLALDYFEARPAQHYNLNRSAKDFADYLLQSRPELIKRFPFLAELADYEWIELEALESSCDSLPKSVRSKFVSQNDAPAIGLEEAKKHAEQFASLIPILNGTLICRQYSFDIPALALAINEGKSLPRLVKPAKSPVCAIVYRDPISEDARYLEVGAVALKLLFAIQSKPDTNYGQLITAICQNVAPEEAGALLTGSLEAIELFKHFYVLVGEI